MKKKELLMHLAQKTNMTMAMVDKFLMELAHVVVSECHKGEKIALPGIGTFSKKHRPSREVRNPRTMEKIMSKAKYVPVFKPTSSFMEHVK